MNRQLPAVRLILVAALVGGLALLPFIGLRIPGIFPGPLRSPGTLDLIARCMLFGALAVTYDLLFGYTGLLSFGHALYFAVGVYLPNIAVTHWDWGFLPAVGLTLVVALLLPLLLGSICLRTTGIPFAMVTLAFAQAGSILVLKNPGGLTGGEEGLAFGGANVPRAFVGVVNTRNLYWLALAYVCLTYLISWWSVESLPGRVWQAIRENERRVEVIGLRPTGFKLLAFVLSSFLATLGGIVYLLLLGGATAHVTTSAFSLTLLVMVVLGGVGSLWGALLGGVLYLYLDERLVALANSQGIQQLPAVLRVPLSQPLFILGALFVILVLFFPGGLAGLIRRAFSGRVRIRRERDALEVADAEPTA